MSDKNDTIRNDKEDGNLRDPVTTDRPLLETLAKHHAMTDSGCFVPLEDVVELATSTTEPGTARSVLVDGSTRSVLDIVPNPPPNEKEVRKDPLLTSSTGTPREQGLARAGSYAGAFSIAGSSNLNLPPPDVESPPPPPPQSEISAHLVEATLVSEEDSPKATIQAIDQVVPEAEAVNAEKEAFQRKRKWGILSCLFVLGAVGITVGGFCATGACSAAEESDGGNGSTPAETASTSIPTMAPSAPQPTLAPLLEEDLIVKGLPDYSLKALQDPTSPQSAAYSWLSEDPFLEDYDNDRLLQRFALSTLYYATGGDHWRNRDHWLSYNHSECLWFNREDFQWYPDYNSSEPCYPNTTQYRYLTPWDNRVVGTIPRQLSLLTGLVNLDLSTSSLTSSIPSQFGQLTNLRKLFLNNNHNLEGPIPSQLAQLSLLDTLSLHDTALTGTLPSQLGELTLLENFWFEFTQVSGTIPDQLCALPNASLWVTYSQVECPTDSTCAKSCT